MKFLLLVLLISPLFACNNTKKISDTSEKAKQEKLCEYDVNSMNNIFSIGLMDKIGLSGCMLDNEFIENINFPDSILVLDLSDNNLSGDLRIRGPKRIQKLVLSNNDIEFVRTGSIEIDSLIISNNHNLELVMLHIRHNMDYLDLSNTNINCLTQFDPSKINKINIEGTRCQELEYVLHQKTINRFTIKEE